MRLSSSARLTVHVDWLDNDIKDIKCSLYDLLDYWVLQYKYSHRDIYTTLWSN